jgi:molybdenum cofactor cytidylyltransferase
MKLVEALQPRLPARIAIVGGGGKTTALFQLARQLPGLVWVTTTTHLGTDQLDFTDQHFIVSETSEIDLPMFMSRKSTLITGLFTPDDRIKGPDPEVIEQLAQQARKQGISFVVEADGSRSHPIKAPAAHEPVIPAWAEMVVVVVGLSALGNTFTPEWVHRPERFEILTGVHQGEMIDMPGITRLLIHPLGGLKNIPAGSEKVALLNQVDTLEQKNQAQQAAPILLSAGYDKVIVGALQNAPDDLAVYQK